VCNLYSMTKSREALTALRPRDARSHVEPAALARDFPGPTGPGRGHLEGRLARGGDDALGLSAGWRGKRPVTNIRNLSSQYWRGWLEQPRFRCVVPATSFVEYADPTPKVAHWFALGDDRPLFAFAGVWRPWTGLRGKEEGTHLLFGILTTEANELTKPIHEAAMPVMLTGDEIDTWLEAPVEEAVKLARPFPPERMKIVLSGPREDPGEIQ
jgi:putative SOS response-associated peptidase YedK